eukprot:6064332-Prymnesium_polylepis.1
MVLPVREGRLDRRVAGRRGRAGARELPDGDRHDGVVRAREHQQPQEFSAARHHLQSDPRYHGGEGRGGVQPLAARAAERGDEAHGLEGRLAPHDVVQRRPDARQKDGRDCRHHRLPHHARGLHPQQAARRQ